MPELSPARIRILEHVQQHPAGVAADEIAQAFGQHPNTVREHLDALVDADLLTRSRILGGRRGRPAWRYAANPDRAEHDPRVREYAALAGALAAHIAEHSDHPSAEARSAGARWGRALVDPDEVDALPADPQGRAACAHERVVALLSELDFGPKPESDGVTVELTTCPILDVARTYPDVVCAVHEGLVAGVLEAMGTSSQGVQMQPFATAHGCLLRLPGDLAGAGGSEEALDSVPCGGAGPKDAAGDPVSTSSTRGSRR